MLLNRIPNGICLGVIGFVDCPGKQVAFIVRIFELLLIFFPSICLSLSGSIVRKSAIFHSNFRRRVREELTL
jgi:hypothetical protein